LFLVTNATVMLTLAFMFSCWNMKPAAATILALSFMFVNVVLESIPFFQRYQHWFLPYHFRSWLWVFAEPVQWGQLLQSQCLLLGFILTVFIVGAAVFQARDIKS
jgi:ABC-2 type transport system permease protein